MWVVGKFAMILKCGRQPNGLITLPDDGSLLYVDTEWNALCRCYIRM
jgi:sugar lactone lactonase YvrE